MKLESEWREAKSIRESLVKEATTMKAMGQLVQAKTLKFDMGSMLKVSGLGGSVDFSSSSLGGSTRPGSGVVGGTGGAGSGADGSAQMRLGALVKELQEQVQSQSKQLQERQAAQDRLIVRLSEETELRMQQEQAVEVCKNRMLSMLLCCLMLQRVSILQEKTAELGQLLEDKQAMIAELNSRVKVAERQAAEAVALHEADCSAREAAVAEAQQIRAEMTDCRGKLDDALSAQSRLQVGNIVSHLSPGDAYPSNMTSAQACAPPFNISLSN